MANKVVYERSGAPAQVVRVVESGEPRAPQRGQVLVRVTAFSVHPGDLAGIAGPFAGADGDALVPGLEATGTVAAIGPGTSVAAGVRAGARVTLFLVPGAWQDWVLAPSELVVAVPDDLPDAVAAQLMINPLTAVLLRRAAGLGAAVPPARRRNAAIAPADPHRAQPADCRPRIPSARPGRARRRRRPARPAVDRRLGRGSRDGRLARPRRAARHRPHRPRLAGQASPGRRRLRHHHRARRAPTRGATWRAHPARPRRARRTTAHPARPTSATATRARVPRR
jgi:hypothetical protein